MTHLAAPARGADRVRHAERHQVVDGEEAGDTRVRAQDRLSGEPGLLALEVGGDCLDDLELSARALSEALRAAATARVAQDPGDHDDPCAAVDERCHRLRTETPRRDVVGADIGGDVDADGRGRLAGDHRVDVDDRRSLRESRERPHEVGLVIGLTT